VGVAFFVVQWAVGVTSKYLIIAALAYLGTIILYDLLVRCTNVTRFLFGMRPLRRKSPEAPAARPGKSAA
jgi:hypothetical protein